LVGSKAFTRRTGALRHVLRECCGKPKARFCTNGLTRGLF
jgi:hypothetical protein